MSPTHSNASDDTFGSATSAWALLEELDKLCEDEQPNCQLDCEKSLYASSEYSSDIVAVERRRRKQYKYALHESELRERKLSLTVKELEADLKAVKKESRRKIQSVRTFWKDKVYGEQARAGIILKKAMQKR